MNLGSLTLGTLHGLLIGLLAVGLVLVYRSDRFLNLAQGQLGALSALLLAKLVLDRGWGYAPAVVLSIAVGVSTGIAIERLFVARLRRRTSSSTSFLLLTLGLSQLLAALLYIRALTPNPARLLERHYPLPMHVHFRLGGVVLGGQDIAVLVVTPLIVGALAAFLRFSMLGKMIRATASNRDSARLCGISPARVSAVTWGIAGGLAAVSAVLVAPSQYGQFDFAALGPEQLFLALGAAAFGAFVSIPMALVGGLALGVAYQLTLGVTANAGTAQVVLFVLVLVVIFVRGRVIGSVFAVEAAPGEDRPPLRVPLRVRERFAVRRQRWLLAGSGLFVAVVLPLLPGLRSEGHRFQLTLVVLYAIVGISITMLVGWSGQLSLGNFAVVGVGAFVTARLAHHGWSVPALLAVTGCLGAGVMLVVGLPALRVRGLTLAVTTLGFGVVASDWLFHASWFTSAPGTILDLHPLLLLRGLGSPSKQLPIYAMSLGLLVVVALAARGLRNSTPGRLIVAVRDDEQAAAAHGVTPATVKLSALAVSGFFAGMVGVLWADAWRVASPEHFAPALSLSLLAVPVIGGLGSVAGAIAGAAALYLPTYFLLDGQPGFQLAFGGLMMVFALLIFPTGLAGAVQRAWEWFLERLDAELPQPVLASVDVPVLAVEHVDVSFGGVQALDAVSIHLRDGEILGLIGSNGAGKSTLINAISGVVRPTRGTVILMGTDVSQLAPELRAGLGLARSFQAAHLFPGLTVRETVGAMLGSRVGIGVLASIARAPWARRAEQTCAAEADLLIDRMGLTPWADTLTAELSTGTRRVCDLAIQLAAKPKVLLLDEPTAGVAQRDAEAFGPLLQRIRDELNCAIIIVEHDMPLLMSLCDRVYAMGEGSIIAEGTPEEIRHNADVVAAYLGTDEVAISRSGRLPSSRKNSRHPNGANGARRTNGKAGASRRPRTPAQAQTMTDTERRAP